MSERIGRQRINREAGYLYFLGKDGYIWKIPDKLNPAGHKARVGNEHFVREEGFAYFLDKQGYTARAKTKDLPPKPGAPHDLRGERPHVVVREVVSREIVKVPCRYCGTLNVNTEMRCASCGAPTR